MWEKEIIWEFYLGIVVEVDHECHGWMASKHGHNIRKDFEEYRGQRTMEIIEDKIIEDKRRHIMW